MWACSFAGQRRAHNALIILASSIERSPRPAHQRSSLRLGVHLQHRVHRRSIPSACARPTLLPQPTPSVMPARLAALHAPRSAVNPSPRRFLLLSSYLACLFFTITCMPRPPCHWQQLTPLSAMCPHRCPECRAVATHCCRLANPGLRWARTIAAFHAGLPDPADLPMVTSSWLVVGISGCFQHPLTGVCVRTTKRPCSWKAVGSPLEAGWKVISAPAASAILTSARPPRSRSARPRSDGPWRSSGAPR
ncbi:hypothetical protein ACVJMY_006524 [Bradyrhizobium diazoefficiens]